MLSRLTRIQSCKVVSESLISSVIRAPGAAGRLRGKATLSKRPLDDLHYHLMKAPSNTQHWTDSVFAVSYLPDPPTTVEGSKTILGVIPALAEEEPGLNDFKENCGHLFWSYKKDPLTFGPKAQFIDLLHDTVRTALADGADEVIVAEASQRGSGWLHIQGELTSVC